MSEQSKLHSTSPETSVYEIRVRGHLSDEWHNWLDGMTIELEVDGTSRLYGSVADQAALHGLLRKVRDLGLRLISVTAVQQSRCAVTQSTNDQVAGGRPMKSGLPVLSEKI